MASPTDEEIPNLINREDELVSDEESWYRSDTDIPAMKNNSREPVQSTLAHRPAVPRGPVTETMAQQVVHEVPLVHRPAVPEIAVQQSQIVQQPSTVQQLSAVQEPPTVQQPPIVKQPPHRRTLLGRNLQRLKRERLKRKRGGGHERDHARDHARDHRNVRVKSPFTIRQEIQDLHMELYRVSYSTEYKKMKPLDVDRFINKELYITEKLNQILASQVVSERLKKMQAFKDIKNFVGEEHTVEEWQEWGKKMVDELDKEQEGWRDRRDDRKWIEQAEERDIWDCSPTMSRDYWGCVLDKIIEQVELMPTKELRLATMTMWTSARDKARQTERDRLRRAEEQKFKKTRRGYVASDQDREPGGIVTQGAAEVHGMGDEMDLDQKEDQVGGTMGIAEDEGDGDEYEDCD
ncbi:hypothetical protein NHQ30_009027 [Ciborinia camelliae]|nr:hypothetical protein NHQ30_009027 [Ciborinia camelliae]